MWRRKSFIKGVAFDHAAIARYYNNGEDGFLMINALI